MNIKFPQAGLVLAFSSVLASCSSEASDPNKASALNNQAAQHAQFIQPLIAQNGGELGRLLVSESQGITLVNPKGQSVSNIKNKAEHLDFRFTDHKQQRGVMSTIDVNTGEILLIEVDLAAGSLVIKQSYKPEQKAIDAVCLSQGSEGTDMFTVNALGEVAHHNVYQIQTNTWQVREINRFTFGPNAKSCAVDESSESVYITEENIGIWRYSINPEHEIIRDLLQLPAGLEVEYVDTTSQGDVAVVSPSINKLWLLNENRTQFDGYDLTDGEAPKSLQLSRIGDTLNAYMFDDEHEVMFQQSFNQPNVSQDEAKQNVKSLPAYAQTQPVVAYGDAADDPAIWVNQHAPENSLVYGTDKKHGLNVYDLQGQLLANLPVGRVNNVDIRYGVKINGKVVDLAAASNRTNKSISLFAIDTKTGMPTLLHDVKTDLDDPYGLCMSKLDSGISVWINDTNGRFQRYELDFTSSAVSANKSQEWLVPSQPEGCVSDDVNKRLYYGEEATGVWLKQIDSDAQDQFIAGLNPEIAADIEGIGLYQLNGKNYLVVSSQGNNRYAVYATDTDFTYLGAFEIGANWSAFIDGASETDGLEVTSVALGKALPNGLMVVQDGRNVMPRAPQNFKLVDGSLLRQWIESKL